MIPAIFIKIIGWAVILLGIPLFLQKILQGENTTDYKFSDWFGIALFAGIIVLFGYQMIDIDRHRACLADDECAESYYESRDEYNGGRN